MEVLMQITKDTYVSLNYTVMDEQGKVLASSEPDGPMDYIHGVGMLVPGLEKALEGKKQGDAVKVKVEPKDAYGDRRQDLIYVMPKDKIQKEGEELKVGMHFEAETPSGPIAFAVTNVDGDNVTLDANHPFAGKTLDFSVSVLECRAATEEELKSILEQVSATSDCGSGTGNTGGCSGCGSGSCGS
jgi:FKBP-type peptidyl-prolyl cis-trans isomerase SlyD